MQKRKKWQHILILAVLFLTVYNTLPTIFFYSKPLKKKISEHQAQEISKNIAKRVNQGEDEAKKWLSAFCKQLKIPPQTITIDRVHPQRIRIAFKKIGEANAFRSHFPKAGSLIPFVPAQLALLDPADTGSKTVTIQRKIPLHFDENHLENYFQYSKKFEENGQPTPFYRTLVFDRIAQLALAIFGESGEACQIEASIASPMGPEKEALVLKTAQQMLLAKRVFKNDAAILKRYLSKFSQLNADSQTDLIPSFSQTLDQVKDQLKLERINLQSEAQRLQSQGDFLETTKQQRLELLTSKENILSEAARFLKKHQSALAKGGKPLSLGAINNTLDKEFAQAQENNSHLQTLQFQGYNPFIESIVIDWNTETITLHPYVDVNHLMTHFESRGQSHLCEQLNLAIINEIAAYSRICGEQITPIGNHFEVKLGSLQDSDRFLALRLSDIAHARAAELLNMLKQNWKPKHNDLKQDAFPIWTYEEFEKLPSYKKKLGLVVYAPVTHSEMPIRGLKNSSVYILAKGLDRIVEKLETSPDLEDRRLFFEDFNNLRSLLQQNGLFGYPGNTLTTNRQFANDLIFEAEDFYNAILKTTREAFNVHGTKRFAILELTNRHQRLLVENRILDQMHEELLKWRDNYNFAQVGINGLTPFDVPKPTTSPLIDNLLLSFKKYFKGDDRKVLNWGLDLSGGKTVQIELRDIAGQIVTGEEEVKQGMNELFERVNKMGVSEVAIRREGNFITVDFPGSQNLSASELIKASSMSLHIVNEKFNEKNPSLGEVSNQFLQDVWNEAVVTGRKTPEEINQIAWRHLHGDSLDPNVLQPRSDAARILYENGLHLASPNDHRASNIFNDSISKIAIQRGEDFTQWGGKTHPLMIIFYNYALEGSHLKNIEAGYDQNKGNRLTFEVKGKETLKNGEKINPRADLFAWTSQFSKDKIAGTPSATFSANDGWRMAVILNGSIITHPTLNFPVKDSATIEGSFTAREVNQLEADLKAGSLTFTPQILSEKNVSPELGAKERSLGIAATILALILVIASMIGYYRFGGLIASVALIFNLLIMWATLQNLGATFTLASIAGVILTLGMAVDANVLVFERIREEFTLNGRLGNAVQAGYKKAFSAIIDSNVTTIIAAIILMQFDSGPIKGFATTLIIGIVSSMFTALFMTRYFFTGWLSKSKRTTLKMSHLIQATKFNFLKYAKPALIISTAMILAGAFLLVKERSSIMGMDFTGGYSLNLEFEREDGSDYRTKIEQALIAQGASSQDIQVRQLNPSHHVRLFLGKGMGNEGHPFFKMPLKIDRTDAHYPYETNPRIQWVVDSLAKSGLSLSKDSLTTLDQSWNEISGQLSDTMRNNALIGLGIAILSILVYITIRFEFKYALSAILCLAHDVLITLSAIALLHFLRVPIQIDLNTVAALMTIVGYSLNDTIIVFDRIREDRLIMRKSSFAQITNHALNVTLSRTFMTSMTTLLVLLPLALLGGSTIFAFSVVMIIGVIFGTLSSLFIAAPILRFFHRQKEEQRETAAQIARQ